MSLLLVHNFEKDIFHIIEDHEASSIDPKTSAWIEIPMNPLEFYVMTIKGIDISQLKLVTYDEYQRNVDTYISYCQCDHDKIIVKTGKFNFSKFDVIAKHTILPSEFCSFSIYHFYHL